MTAVTCKIKEYIQPFERELALAELRALSGDDPVPVDGSAQAALSFRVNSKVSAENLRTHLAYWEAVSTQTTGITQQLRGEATSLIARNGLALNDMPDLVPRLVDEKTLNRRCLRYATHGLHEYRGKFFPQLVRSLINMAEVPRRGIVLDPMCGSGTTLVETVLAGRRAFGLDMNPLSVFLSEVKCQALALDPRELIGTYETLTASLKKPLRKRSPGGHFASLDASDQDYLEKWFAPHVLDELDYIRSAIDGLSLAPMRSLYTLSLSNILREVSWQKLDDLRVRKEVRRIETKDVLQRYLEETLRATKMVVAYNAQRGIKGLGVHEVHESDARLAVRALPKLKGRVDAVITSPPYATALPYLDTDRLSLIYLNLLPRSDHRTRDTLMIGNREVTGRKRQSYWDYYEENRQDLPKATCSMIDQIDSLNKQSDEVGFRRRNLSALLSKYFFDMKAVIEQQRELLADHGTMFMVIGNNRTTAGGVPVEIRTTDHLAKIAESVGFRLAGNLSMDMLVSRDIFRNNAMPSEQIITLQKAQ